jgi:hypothetical protein
MGWHGMDAAAPDCFDSSGRCTPRVHGESGPRIGEGGMNATDRRGRGASGARCQWQGVGGRQKRGAARRWGTDMRAWPAQCRAARFKLGLKPVQM